MQVTRCGTVLVNAEIWTLESHGSIQISLVGPERNEGEGAVAVASDVVSGGIPRNGCGHSGDKRPRMENSVFEIRNGAAVTRGQDFNRTAMQALVHVIPVRERITAFEIRSGTGEQTIVKTAPSAGRNRE